MSFRATIKDRYKKKGAVRGRRWIIKFNKDDTVREIKMIHNPETYTGEYKLTGDRKLIQILDKNYEKTKNIS